MIDDGGLPDGILAVSTDCHLGSAPDNMLGGSDILKIKPEQSSRYRVLARSSHVMLVDQMWTQLTGSRLQQNQDDTPPNPQLTKPSTQMRPVIDDQLNQIIPGCVAPLIT
jgi:hypothetical protein